MNRHLPLFYLTVWVSLFGTQSSFAQAATPQITGGMALQAAPPIEPSTAMPQLAPQMLARDRAGDALTEVLLEYPEVHRLFLEGNISAALKVFNAQLSGHENDPAYFNLLGVLLLSEKSYHAAADAFEHVVLIQPDNAGAWVDLALASADAGNFVTALGYITYIEENFSPPPAIERILQAYRMRIVEQQRQAKKLPWQASAELRFGYDSNANSGLHNGLLAVTFNQQVVTLNLDPASLARSDHFRQAGLSAKFHGKVAAQEIEFTLAARQKDFLREVNSNQLDLNSSLTLHHPTFAGDLNGSLSANYFVLAGQPLLYDIRLGAGLEHPLKLAVNPDQNSKSAWSRWLPADLNCRLGFSVEAEALRYISPATVQSNGQNTPQTTTSGNTQSPTDTLSQNANLLWLQTGLACDAFERQWQAVTLTRYGFDRPQTLRAGGASRRTEWITQISRQFPKILSVPLRFDLSYTWARAQDSEGYSPLLDNFSIRHTERQSARAQLSTVLSILGKPTQLIVSTEKTLHHSNLALFRQSGYTMSVGVAQNF